MNLYIKTFGCQMNERDSEIIEQLLLPAGYIPVADPEQADLVILNTCSIRAKAEQKVYSLLGQLRSLKKTHPSMIIGVAGCVAQQEGPRIQVKMPHVDLVIGTQQIYRIPDLVADIRSGLRISTPGASARTGKNVPRTEVSLSDTFAIPPFQNLLYGQAPPSPAVPEFKKFVTIMQGCNNYCSYCVVPYTRGREISRPVQDILEEVRLLVRHGVREITLLGQNVNSYGRTNQVADQPVNFAALLRRVADIDGIRRLRFTTSNPKDLSGELMQCFADLDILCSHFHLPVQSGSNAILARMNRKYTVEQYMEQIHTLRSCRPDIALSTDIIVGFPGETDEDFAATMQLLEEVRFHSSFSFKYSDRPGTRSADFANKVDEEVKTERLKQFQARQDEISLERNRACLNQTMEVMVEGPGRNGLFSGRTPTNHIVHFKAPRDRAPVPGSELLIRITRAGHHSLTGTVVENRG